MEYQTIINLLDDAINKPFKSKRQMNHLNLSDNNGVQTHNHLARKRTLNNLTKLDI